MDGTAAFLVDYKLVILVGCFVVLFVAERLWPATEAMAGAAAARAPWRRDWRRPARNLGLFLAVAAISPLIVLPVSAWASEHALGLRPAWWHWTLDILLLDFWIYWWHRANHRIPFLWRFHEVHHLDRFLDTSSALRFHAGEVLWSAFVRAAVIVLLSIPLTSVLIFETLVLAAAIFHHSNLRLPPAFERALSRVVITPSIHWVHHHPERADTDSNYGTILSIWDPLFGSRNRRPRTPDMEIGTEGVEERQLAALFLRPFERRG